MSCGVSFMKFTLIFFNVIFLLIGLAGVGVGIWIAVDPNGLFNLINYQTDQSTTLVQTSSYVFIAACAFILIVAAFGIFGACTGNRCMLGFYAFCVILIFALELAALITVVVYDAEFREDFEAKLREELKKSYADKDNAFSSAVDSFQSEFQCCGITNHSDYETLIGMVKDDRWVSGRNVPVSCYDDTESKAEDYFKKGCYQKLRDFISTFAGAIIGIVVAILVFEMILFTFAICLCRHEDFGDKVV